ncbi:MAG: DUF6285 domain-containing protein [Burkholderiales bacterium]
MRDHPDSANLLASARRALLEQVVPGLEGEAHSTALMLARVFSVLTARLAVDARALAAIESGAGTEELAGLAGLLGETPSAARLACGGTHAAIASLSRQLAAAIRRGSFDPPGPEHDALLRFLLEITRAKVAENNPKALEAIGRAQEEET